MTQTDEAGSAEIGVRDLGPRIVREVFGGPFYQQGRGYYVSLEFFAIAKGVMDLAAVQGKPDTLLAMEDDHPLMYRRSGFDFARRLMHGANLGTKAEGKLKGRDTAKALQTLLEGLERSVPGRLATPKNWQARHFYPYPSEFIHYDAVTRGKKISVERYLFRGAGSFVYRVLSKDVDFARRERIQRGLRELLAPADSSLGRIAAALASLDEGHGANEDFSDDRDLLSLRADIDPADTPWITLLREGVDVVLNRQIPKYRKVEALMNWLPLCVAFHQRARARRFMGQPVTSPIVFDAGVRASPVRSQSKQDLRSSILVITEALEKRAMNQEYWRLRAAKSQSWKTDPRSFFTGTLFAAGVMNALKGADRFFQLTPKALETFVLALVSTEVSFETFCHEVLYRRLGFVVDGRSMEDAGIQRIEKSTMDANAEELSKRLGSLGLLRSFSDATRMVSVETVA